MSRRIPAPDANHIRLVHGTARKQSGVPNAYHVDVLGEVVNLFDVPADHTHAVLFEEFADSAFWWGYTSTVRGADEARRALHNITHGKRGKACLVYLHR